MKFGSAEFSLVDKNSFNYAVNSIISKLIIFDQRYIVINHAQFWSQRNNIIIMTTARKC